MQQGKAGRRNKVRLVELFQRACDASDLEACDELGSLLDEDASSVALYRKSCDAGYMPACGHLASVLLVNGDMEVLADKEPDIKAAIALAKKSCEAGHANSCTILGGVYRQGKPVKKDHPLAKQYLEHACELGDYRGCTINGTMYELGWDGEKPDEVHALVLRQNAFKLLQASCDEKLEPCDTLAEYHADGVGTKQDPVKEIEVLRTACDRGHPRTCVLFGIKMEDGRGVPKNLQGAGALYQRACEDGDGSGCYRLAHLYAKGNGFPQDERRATELEEKACHLGFGPSCTRFAVTLEKQDATRALGLYRRACRRGDSGGCRSVAAFLLGTQGHGVPPKDAYPEALRSYLFACDQKDGLGCFGAAWIHELGLGVSKSRTKAKELAQKACELGARPGCEWVKDPAHGPRQGWVDFVQQQPKR
ncbi:tetratricopeptide repeat protein [Polyangium mundeleinium]|uniref:Tetratricopeptide repeat protein n=1 Tax=Polyangium mundeleinium TaxID=2995306 RepID=A0ABT5F277_9BACT|nr:tetratricopeptide repeat protein [Polyangium mundeleinium]MDC0748170.1 tetratricopeptide repeat protein [Polyangium mundeleinium]